MPRNKRLLLCAKQQQQKNKYTSKEKLFLYIIYIPTYIYNHRNVRYNNINTIIRPRQQIITAVHIFYSLFTFF